MTQSTAAIKAVLEHHPEIETAIVFGSMAAGRARYDSDVDLAVAAQQPMSREQKIALMDDLAEATGRPVDLIDLQVVGEPLLGQILKRGKRLLGSDESFAELIMRHLIAEEDFMPYYRRILAERRRAWTGT